MKHAVVLSLVLMLVGFEPSLALANKHAFKGTDTAEFGGMGADFVPSKKGALRMVTQSVWIQKMKPGGKWKSAHWQVHATYLLENPTKEDVTVEVGQPESFCFEQGGCANQKYGSKRTFFGMKTWVNAKKVSLKTSNMSTPKNVWRFEVGRGHFTTLSVKAGQNIKINHQYQMGLSNGEDQGDMLMYMTKPGSLWSGPIGSATYTVVVPERPWGFHYPKDFKLKSYGPMAEGTPKGTTKIVFHMKNWTPKQDLDLLLGSNAPSLYGCPSMMWTPGLISERLPNDVTKFNAKFAKLSKSQLKVCRNLPYARHGYSFKSKKLQKLFYGKKVSKPITKVPQSIWGFSKYGFSNKDYQVVMFAPNPSYSPNLLTEEELKWVKRIKAIESQRKKSK